MNPRAPTSPLFPYTTLFRSRSTTGRVVRQRLLLRAGEGIFMRLVRLRAPGGLENLKLVEEDHPKPRPGELLVRIRDRKSTRLNSSHPSISYAVFCLKKKR